MADYKFLEQSSVQFFLDNVGDREFTVIFLKMDNTQRKLVGHLDTKQSTRKTTVHMMTFDGWKSFDTSRVLSIQ